MKVTILGCGTSSGVPLIGNNWGACDPHDPRNSRTRVSILVEECDKNVLVDTSPDMRQQLLRCDLQKLDAVLYTHEHADHCHGIDELRSVNWLTKKPIDIYADDETMRLLEERFSYIFQTRKLGSYAKPSVSPHIIKGSFSVGKLEIVPFIQGHGAGQSLGFRFADFAYSTDVNALDDAAFAALAGIKVWVVDCVREDVHPTHSHLAQTLDWIARVQPERAYLTHMSCALDYEKTLAKLPSGVWPAYDGLVLEC